MIGKVAVLDVPPPGAGLKTVTLADPAVAMSAAGMLAVSRVPLTYVVGGHSRSSDDRAAHKVRAIDREGECRAAGDGADGLRLRFVGTGIEILIGKGAALDVPPPGAGLKTVTLADPAVAMSAAGMLAVSRVSLTYVVARALPFQRTTEPLTKFVPLTVRLNAGPPTLALDGLRLVIVGAGLLLIEKVAALDVPPPGAGLKTVTLADPAVAMSAAGMLAVSRVSLTYVVARALPFQRTTEPPTKFVPLTVRVNAGPPTLALDGLRLVIVGTGICAVGPRQAVPHRRGACAAGPIRPVS